MFFVLSGRGVSDLSVVRCSPNGFLLSSGDDVGHPAIDRVVSATNVSGQVTDPTEYGTDEQYRDHQDQVEGKKAHQVNEQADNQTNDKTGTLTAIHNLPSFAQPGGHAQNG